MHILKTTFAIAALGVATILPVFAQDAAAEPATATAAVEDPTGTFMDEFGTSFTFSLCGENGTDLCAILTTLEGNSATEENLAFVGTQVMQATPSSSNVWKGSIAAGGMSADATVTKTGPDTIDVQGCRAAILCKTLTYTRVS